MNRARAVHIAEMKCYTVSCWHYRERGYEYCHCHLKDDVCTVITGMKRSIISKAIDIVNKGE